VIVTHFDATGNLIIAEDCEANDASIAETALLQIPW
jgi:hypothetical protein